MTRRFPATEQELGTTRTLLGERDGGLVRRTVLPGGLRVVTEAMPQVRSVAVGIWVGTGSRDETPALSGASHLLEHLLFKGTARRSAMDISSALDAVGGGLNAFTDRELTCYYARVLDDDLPLAVDVLADMVASSLLRTADVDSERQVVLDELAMHDDDPEDAAQELLVRQVWGPAPLARPVAGTPESVGGLRVEQVRRYYRRHYRPDNTVVAVAGNVRHPAVVRLVRAAFAPLGFLAGDAGPRSTRTAARTMGTRDGVSLRSRPTEQANLMLGLPGVSRGDPRRYTLGVLNAVLGGGASSRLFQEVRERRGLAYHVASHVESYVGAGMLAVHVGCLPGNADQVLTICREQLAGLAEHGVDEAELARGKGQLRGGLVLGLEDTGSRMSRLAKAELVQGELPAVGELLARIDAVERDDVHALARDLLSATPAVAVVGPFENADRFAA